MDHPRKNLKTKHDDRVILHFDLDCFYAQVFENKTPSLKSLPLGIRQKSLLATCNYPARRLGVKKLMSIASALAICPDLVIVDGEDLTPFRDVSKRLYALLRSYSWNDRVERLGLDEVWMDVSDMVEYNLELLNRNDLEHSWFCLDKEDPEKGFAFDGRGFAGCVYGRDHFGLEGTDDAELLIRTKLVLASHLALYLRLKIEEEGYTTACGISTNKLLAKLVGNVNKPRNQTTLLSCGPDGEENVRRFMGSHQLRKVPGIGGKTAAVLSDFFISGSKPTPNSNSNSNSNSTINPKEISIADLLSLLKNPPLTPSKLDSLLSPLPGGQGTGSKQILSLLHGHDPLPVKPARSLPTQISIEDTYHSSPLTSLEQVRQELVKITQSLLKRLRTDLWDDDKKRWVARPRTLRLTTRPRTTDPPRENRGYGYGYGRVSKSQGLPGYVFSSLSAGAGGGIGNGNGEGKGNGDGENTAAMAAQIHVTKRLVTETLLPMFRELNPLGGPKDKTRGRGYCIGLLNVCVTNMDSVETSGSGGGGGGGGGRDIKDMFTSAREFTVYDHSAADQAGYDAKTTQQPGIEETIDDDMVAEEVDMDSDITSPPRGNKNDDNDNDNDNINHQQDPVLDVCDYEQDSRIPTTTSNDYFHIEDDDDIWDDQEDNTWNNDGQSEEEDMMDHDYPRDAGGSGEGINCPLCSHFIPLFALSAHERFHSMEGEEGD
ncbi:hypothetical protein B0H65DRAFT_524612 [Neurospora tetraspora]|uniref:UmuC domain-containing protein n=1 Tax=Neurospora tetraspora TaxID=94610 RepID=A0AAE0MRK5_9PEZI|nr:hypothetical protein B0H65DRAFT_524612 [Neurospora tetraspora]